MLLVDPGPEEGDAALAAALRQVPSVIAAAGVFPESTQSVTRDDNDPNRTQPQLPSLRDFRKGARLPSEQESRE